MRPRCAPSACAQACADGISKRHEPRSGDNVAIEVDHSGRSDHHAPHTRAAARPHAPHVVVGLRCTCGLCTRSAPAPVRTCIAALADAVARLAVIATAAIGGRLAAAAGQGWVRARGATGTGRRLIGAFTSEPNGAFHDSSGAHGLRTVGVIESCCKSRCLWPPRQPPLRPRTRRTGSQAASVAIWWRSPLSWQSRLTPCFCATSDGLRPPRGTCQANLIPQSLRYR